MGIRYLIHTVSPFLVDSVVEAQGIVDGLLGAPDAEPDELLLLARPVAAVHGAVVEHWLKTDTGMLKKMDMEHILRELEDASSWNLFEQLCTWNIMDYAHLSFCWPAMTHE